MNKTDALCALHARMQETLAPHVAFGQLVFGAGSDSASLAFVGEAPGRFEAEQGVPFVGAAGRNLDALLQRCGLQRPSVYITNAVPFRPVRSGAREGTFANRPPTQAEIALCRPFLTQELAIVRPRVVATLGNTPLRALLGKQAPSVGEAHGRLIEKEGLPFGVFALYHPASVIYNRALADTLARDMETLGVLLQGE